MKLVTKKIKTIVSCYITLTDFFELGFYLYKNGFSFWIGWLYIAFSFGEKVQTKFTFAINTSEGIIRRKDIE